MNIIEKLGIEPIDSHNFDQYFDEGEGWDYCHEGEVREVEQQRNELLEALIEQTKDSINMYINHYGASKTTKEIETMHTDIITIIEKAGHPKKWQEIKELL